MKAKSAIAVAVLAAAAWSAAPAMGVPTGSYEEGAPLRIVAQPGDEEVRININTSPEPMDSPDVARTSITGDVQLTYTGEACSSGPGWYSCRNEPSLILLDGGSAHADLSVDAWSEGVPVTLKAGLQGGRLALSAVEDARFVGRSGPDRVIYKTNEFPKTHHLRVNTGGGDDVVVLRGGGGAMLAQDDRRAELLLGAGSDRMVVRTSKPTKVRVYGGAGNDVLQVSHRDIAYGGGGADSLANGRVLWGGPGHDTLSGGPNARVIGAADGERDVVRCVTNSTVAYVDAVDRVTGPCRVVMR